MALQQERRASRLLLFRKGRGLWLLAAIAALILLLVFVGIGSPEDSDISLRDLASIEKVGQAVSQSFVPDPSVEKLPEPLQIRLDGLFAEIQKNPENKAALLRELKRVLQQNFKGQEDCWSCPGSDYFNRYDEVSGTSDSRKPMGLEDWIVLGDEAFEKNRLDEARENYTEALQIIDERVFQPDEAIDTSIIRRLSERCVELNCR